MDRWPKPLGYPPAMRSRGAVTEGLDREAFSL